MVTPGGVLALAVDMQDRIIGVGSVFEEFQQIVKVVRFLPNGQWDASFGDSGMVVARLSNVSDVRLDVLFQLMEKS